MRSTQSVPVLVSAWAVRGNVGVGVGAGLLVGVALAVCVGYAVALTVCVGVRAGLGVAVVGSTQRSGSESVALVALLPKDAGKQTCQYKQRRSERPCKWTTPLPE